MLTKVIIENFKSFERPAELIMVSSTKIRTNVDHRIQIKNTRLLKHAVVYGANASGKTNLIDFFRFFEATLEYGLPLWSTRFFCKNHSDNEKKESNFEIQFSVKESFYAYGFSAVLSEQRITSEWLYELFQNGSSRGIFQRDNSAETPIVPILTLPSADRKRFKTYANDFSENSSSLFLAEMNRNKKIAADSKLLVFQEVYSWLRNNVFVYTPNAPITDFRYYYNAESLARINRLISTFDTGISNIRIEEITINEMTKMLPEEIFKEVMKDLRLRMEKSGAQHISMSMRSGTSFFNIEMNAKQEPKVTTIRMKHGASFFDFGFEDESDGTRRLFDLLDMLLANTEDVIFIVDELERSLHPKLTQRFLELFSEMHRGHKTQLLFTTHESSIMDQDLFRRDEIWFVERSNDNNSTLYSLDRFKERYDKVLSKAYLEGRYGAIPVFSKFAFREE